MAIIVTVFANQVGNYRIDFKKILNFSRRIGMRNQNFRKKHVNHEPEIYLLNKRFLLTQAMKGPQTPNDVSAVDTNDFSSGKTSC